MSSRAESTLWVDANVATMVPGGPPYGAVVDAAVLVHGDTISWVGRRKDLDDQAAMWQLLDPDEVGIRLTDEMMMDPEASVSALVFHHPDARYFSVSGSR